MPVIPEPLFSFSTNALKAIESLRPHFEAVSLEKSGAVVVAWGTTIAHDVSQSASGIIITFYTESQMTDMARYARRIDGLDVVLFTMPDNYHRFDGKIIDHTNGKGFFFVSS
jgi:hypothetical protein